MLYGVFIAQMQIADRQQAQRRDKHGFTPRAEAAEYDYERQREQGEVDKQVDIAYRNACQQ